MNNNYIINKKYLFRIKKNPSSLIEDKRIEKQIEEELVMKGITIPCLYYSEKEGVKITKFIEEGENLSSIKLNKKILFATARKLKDLHNLKIKAPTDFNIEQKVQFYREEAFIEKHPLEDKILANIKKYYTNSDLCFCHNDLISKNILKCGKNIYFINLEFSANNNPYFDIFSFLSQNDISGKDKEIFIDAYFYGKAPKNIKQISNDFSALLDLIWYYWSIMMYKNDYDPKYSQLEQAKYEKLLSYKFE